MSNWALRHFSSDNRGSIATTFALVLVPVIGLVGMGVDYTTGASIKARLDDIADSASLAAVTPTMLSQSDQALQKATA
jgi:Flp pilus assembly protein TadG